MAGEEGDPATADLAEEEGVARPSVRGVHTHLRDVLQEGVQARAADDTDLCVRHAITVAARENAGSPVERIDGAPGGSAVPCAAQAAEVLLFEAEEGAEDDFESDPVEAEAEAEAEDDEESDDEAEPDAFAEDEAGVLLDEEPRLSFR
ncbi:hypothetical protein GCM10015535_43930 [Streptomyces gelaticus]|uniref:Uncharacterized protein n=1 Tax=Streptomyces gelaticus TaxID=285446 RepID=A0ABQ2W5H5_9ACTN|nr:hypothetical protein GCM10015535_43930 [Streptomyces gelaticus]